MTTTRVVLGHRRCRLLKIVSYVADDTVWRRPLGKADELRKRIRFDRRCSGSMRSFGCAAGNECGREALEETVADINQGPPLSASRMLGIVLMCLFCVYSRHYCIRSFGLRVVLQSGCQMIVLGALGLKAPIARERGGADRCRSIYRSRQRCPLSSIFFSSPLLCGTRNH